jgi:hypothetical protein
VIAEAVASPAHQHSSENQTTPTVSPVQPVNTVTSTSSIFIKNRAQRDSSHPLETPLNHQLYLNEKTTETFENNLNCSQHQPIEIQHFDIYTPPNQPTDSNLSPHSVDNRVTGEHGNASQEDSDTLGWYYSSGDQDERSQIHPDNPSTPKRTDKNKKNGPSFDM